jgi:catechol 2,3-dioxygenase-like lactoylglutathione lyase family enzyme
MMPMQLKHLNLTTSDVGGLASFFERFFGFKRLMTRGQDTFALMCNQDEFVLTLMKAKEHDPAAYPETFHVGFYLGAPDAVQAKHDELSQAGLAPGKVLYPSRGGSRVTTFYCNAPGGVVIEIATPPGLAAE